MRYITIWCGTEGCPAEGQKQTVPAGRPYAPGVYERVTNLVCEVCGQDVRLEAAK